MTRLRSILTWTIWIVLCTVAAQAQSVPVGGVEAVGLTVSDMDRSVSFYTGVLHFRETSDVELSGSEIEHLKGIFGVKVRVVELQLGAEKLDWANIMLLQVGLCRWTRAAMTSGFSM